ncbi:MAG: hypothetical protein RLY71_2149 [Pseudomonadota bacterium]
MAAPFQIFNPQPHVETVAIGNSGAVCLVIDDALLDPQSVIDLAVEFQGSFAPPERAAYPGVLLPLPRELEAQLGEFFRTHARTRLGARRTVDTLGRYALVTTPPAHLLPCQWLPHRDRAGLDPASQCIIASVLYLFSDAKLGGTAFFEPRVDGPAMEGLVQDSLTLDHDAMHARHGLVAAYPTQDNHYVRCVARIPARFNRMIFYDGNLLHTSDQADIPAHAHDPRRGRLTVNGFFTCTRPLTR